MARKDLQAILEDKAVLAAGGYTPSLRSLAKLYDIFYYNDKSLILRLT